MRIIKGELFWWKLVWAGTQELTPSFPPLLWKPSKHRKTENCSWSVKELGFPQVKESKMPAAGSLQIASSTSTWNYFVTWASCLLSSLGHELRGGTRWLCSPLSALTFCGMQRAQALLKVGQPGLLGHSLLQHHLSLCPPCSQMFRKCSPLVKHCP